MSGLPYEYPWVVSADDHVVEPPSIWWDRLSTRDRELGPRVEQDTCETTTDPDTGGTVYIKGKDGPMTDWWVYEDWAKPMSRVSACAGLPWEMHTPEPINYADMRPGYYQPAARVADMDLNYTERSLCFPNMIRFCGQIFHEAKDKDIAMKCVRAYNDWMIDEWCGPYGGRLIPLCLVPFWDPVATAAEIRRNAGRGCRAITFPEIPNYLGLPSIYDPSGFWEPVFEACNETSTVICMHIGSGSKLVQASPHAPMAVTLTMKHDVSQLAMTEWLCSGVLARYPKLKIAFSESQIGWVPYVLERIDKVYTHETYAQFPSIITEPPSTYMKGRVYLTFFDDETGVRDREAIGVSQIAFEVDYPHQDTTWPDTRLAVEKMAKLMDASELEKVLRGNTLEMLGLPDTL
jgi:predicted TIM-barrel fold metal-dependent hydrolase